MDAQDFPLCPWQTYHEETLKYHPSFSSELSSIPASYMATSSFCPFLSPTWEVLCSFSKRGQDFSVVTGADLGGADTSPWFSVEEALLRNCHTVAPLSQ